jgi:hypothetical protein
LTRQDPLCGKNSLCDMWKLRPDYESWIQYEVRGRLKMVYTQVIEKI